MKVVITGGLGFIGLALARQLLAQGVLTGPDGSEHELDRVVLFDAVKPPGPLPDTDERVEIVIGDIAEAAEVAALVDRDDIAVFHFASVVSAGGELDFDLALRVNLDGGRNVLEACRARGSCPRFVLSSTVATFGGSAMAASVSDTTKQTPQTTYGTTKAILELLVNDYTRKGFLDGRTARLPSVIVRPGGSFLAASAFASAVIREPLEGRDFTLPVPMDTRIVVIGHRAVVGGLIRLYEVDSALLGDDRSVNFPNITVSVAEMIESLERVAGDRPLGSISVRPDPAIGSIVATWPTELAWDRAERLGLLPDAGLDDAVRAYIEDYLEPES